jgi:hypothetical protein
MDRGCEATPPQVASVRCNACDYDQPPGRVCVNPDCLKPFSANHCEICMVWTQSDIHHCVGCGLCRVGKADTLFHCDKCEACFHISTKDGHSCTVLSMKHQRCPLCLDATHSSQRRCVILRCGHVGHYDCLQQAWSHDRGTVPKCPTCRKSLLSPDSMKVYGDAIRHSIESQPLTAELVAVHVGDEVQTRYGRFVVDAVVAVAGPTGTTPPTSSRRHSPRDHNLYRGRLVDWVLGGRAATATLRIKDLKKDLKVRSSPTFRPRSCRRSSHRHVPPRLARFRPFFFRWCVWCGVCGVQVNISCNDCEVRSEAKFHFLGLECAVCKGYNTARV